MGLDHLSKLVAQFGQLAQMVTNLRFATVFLDLTYLLLIAVSQVPQPSSLALTVLGPLSLPVARRFLV
ncbi:MAG: hypothetical protein DMG16_19825 [Acidobacteria bacterium]|nr:MAG: hypothetical protein DMG16_19825 [Acidobacteriota bacterium]